MGYSCNNELIKPLSFDINYVSQPLNPKHCNSDGSGHQDNRKSTRTGSSRWNPTPEQIVALEELYRGGTRTPTTQQIQEIANKLREFGRIEGKNVFYWFQNHKARERQKRRRREVDVDNAHEHQHSVVTEKEELSVLRRTGGDRVEQTKSCPSSPATQDLVPSNHKQNGNTNGTTEDSERRCEGEKDATWQSPMIPSNTSQCNHHVIITSQVPELDREIIMNQNEYNVDEEEETREIRTLDLFPVTENQEESDAGGYTGTRKPNPLCCNNNNYYYYEFMPLKN